MSVLSRIYIGTLAVFLTLTCLPHEGHASGFGPFYVTGGGSSTIRADSQPDRDADIRIKGAGLFYDNNLSGDRLFNYRIGIGTGTYGDKDDSYDAIVIFNDFGFGLARNPYGRLWLGPEIILTHVDDQSAATKPKLFGMGMGPVIGLNLNVSEHITFTLKAAYISQTMAGDMDIGGTRYDVNTDDIFTYISFSLAYRFSEYF